MSGYEGMAGDTTILRGIDAIVNRDQVAQGIDLDAIERALVGETPVHKSQAQVTEITRAISNAMSELNITAADLPGADVIEEVRRPTSAIRTPPRATPTVINNRTWDDDEDNDDGADDGADGGMPPRGSPVPRAYGIPRPSQQYGGEPQTRLHVLDAETREQMEDEKAGMIADIDELIMSLELDGKDLTRIRRPDQMSSYEEVESTLRLLQRKVDRTRCSTLAEEIIIFGAMAMEEIFDGQHQYLGYSPDLTGFHNVARSKLRRVRSETSQIASAVLRDNAIGPTARLLMEFIPAMVLHARNRSKQHGQPSMFDDDNMAETNSRLRG